jgi:hypothetical protein
LVMLYYVGHNTCGPIFQWTIFDLSS